MGRRRCSRERRWPRHKSGRNAPKCPRPQGVVSIPYLRHLANFRQFKRVCPLCALLTLSIHKGPPNPMSPTPPGRPVPMRGPCAWGAGMRILPRALGADGNGGGGPGEFTSGRCPWRSRPSRQAAGDNPSTPALETRYSCVVERRDKPRRPSHGTIRGGQEGRSPLVRQLAAPSPPPADAPAPPP